MKILFLYPNAGSQLGFNYGIAHLSAVLKQAGLTSSTSESFRMIQQGAVKLDGERVSERGLELERGSVFVAQVGKRKFARISLD